MRHSAYEQYVNILKKIYEPEKNYPNVEFITNAFGLL